MKRTHLVPAVLIGLLAVLGVAQATLQRLTATQRVGADQIPKFQVDPLWPKPLPNKWVMGSVIGVSVDSRNDVWIAHRPSSLVDNEKAAALKPPLADCCFPAPPILVFNQGGDLVQSWGGPGAGYDWPASEHGIYVDYKDNVWIGGNGAKDTHVVKFTRTGKFLLQIGKPGTSSGSNDTQNLNKPTTMTVDPSTNEVYVADGYGNRRVIVFDADTGQYKRHWGAYGRRPDDSDPYNNAGAVVGKDYDPNKLAQQFGRAVHGVAISKDGLVYVSDRVNNRIQVFKKDGTFVKEGFINRRTLGFGSAFESALSVDPQQQFLYNVDGMNQKVDIIRRDTLEILSSFGQGGRYPGQFFSVHSVAIDSRGNVYTGETLEGKRVQRFVYKGMGPIAATTQVR
jgi:DNA-binding beta-propeller fold protein YncE